MISYKNRGLSTLWRENRKVLKFNPPTKPWGVDLIWQYKPEIAWGLFKRFGLQIYNNVYMLGFAFGIFLALVTWSACGPSIIMVQIIANSS
jgi:hypothetical protein